VVTGLQVEEMLGGMVYLASGDVRS